MLLSAAAEARISLLSRVLKNTPRPGQQRQVVVQMLIMGRRTPAAGRQRQEVQMLIGQKGERQNRCQKTSEHVDKKRSRKRNCALLVDVLWVVEQI